MATTYAELKRRVQLLIDRDDADAQIADDGVTVDMLDVFIADAEKRFYRSEAARIPPLEKFVTFTVGSGTGTFDLSIPGDYFETRYLTAVNASSVQVTLARTSPEQVLNRYLSASNLSYPDVFAYGNKTWVIPRASQQVTVTAVYYGFLDSLKTTTDSDHWILNNADDLISYWAAVEAALYYGSIDANQMQLWEARGQYIHDQIVEQEIRQQSSGSTPKQVRPYR